MATGRTSTLLLPFGFAEKYDNLAHEVRPHEDYERTPVAVSSLFRKCIELCHTHRTTATRKMIASQLTITGRFIRLQHVDARGREPR